MSFSNTKNTTENSSSVTNMDQNVWGGQTGALQGMYGQANDLYNTNQGLGQSMNQMANPLSQQLGGYANQANQGFQNQIGGGSIGNTADIRARLMNSFDRQAGGSQMGNMYNSIVGGQGNTYIDPMVSAMRQGGMENLNRMQAGTGLDAAAMGQSGSSRHAMQNAMQSRDMNRDMLDREMQMRGGAYDTDLGMKMDIARQADTNAMANQSNMMQALGMGDQNIQAGMQNAGQMQNLGMGQMAPYMQAQNAGWNNMGGLSSTIGAPTVLSTAESVEEANRDSVKDKRFGPGAGIIEKLF